MSRWRGSDRAAATTRRDRHPRPGVRGAAAAAPARPAPGGAGAPAGRPRQRRPVLSVEGVTKSYDMGDFTVRALRGITLQVERGDFVAIMGSSGSGKSTLMNILGCLDIPTRGRYLLDGIDVSSYGDDDLADIRNRRIGFVFQSFNLVPRTRTIANVELPLAYAGMARAARRRRALAALASVGMGNRAEHLPSELSGGQQQRVAVARAIVTNPPLILADEPTGNLDSRSTDDVLRIFADLNAEGRTVVLITHEDEVAQRAKRVIRLTDGRIMEDRRVVPVRERLT